MCPKEETEQRALVQWLKLKKITYFAVQNENNFSFLNRNIAVKMQSKAKSMGSVKGVSDMVVMLPSKILFIELKRVPKKLKSGKLSYTNSKTSQDQLDFISVANGFEYAEARVCYGYLEAIELIESNM